MTFKFLRPRQGNKENPSITKSRRLLKKNLNDSNAMFYIGRHYLCGTGVLQHTPTAYLWLEKAYSHGHKKAASLMALIQLSWHDEGVPKDIPGTQLPRRADFQEIRDLAITGHLDGCPIGSSVIVKISVRTKDCPVIAEHLPAALLHAAEAKDVLSCAICVQKAILQNDTRSIQKYMALGGHASPHAHLMLSQFYNGQADFSRALEHLEKAAELHHPEAQYHLGRRKIVEKDHLTGESLLRRAATAGHATAAAALGDLYRQEELYNKQEAIKWYGHAVSLGHQKANEALSSITH